MNNVYDERVLQEIGWGNYSEVKKITVIVLRSKPNNNSYIYIRDYIEYHKKSNGRYETLSLNQFLQYVVDNIEAFYEKEDLTLFFKCLYKDIFNIDIVHKIGAVKKEYIDTIINRFEHLESIQNSLQNISSEVLLLNIEKLKEIRKLYDEYMEKEKEKEIALLNEKHIEEEKKLNEKKKTAITIIICVIICLIACLIKVNG